MEPMEKPDANMALKYTFGVNAWRQWVRIPSFHLYVQCNKSILSLMDNFRTIGNWKKCRIGEADYSDEENKIVQNGSSTAYCG